MAIKKPFVAKNGLTVSATNVFGTNAKLHANNAITDGTITLGMLQEVPASNANFQSALANTNSKLLNIETNLLATNTDIRTAISNAVSDLVASAPAALDTLNELAAALGDDANFATTLTNNLSQKLGASASVTLDGDVTGTASFSGNSVTITTAVADDSHNHIISNVDGLQASLDNKMSVANAQALASSRLGATASVTLTGDVTGNATFSSNAVTINTTDTNLGNTNAYIASTLLSSQNLYTNVTANLNSYIANTNPRITDILNSISSTNTNILSILSNEASNTVTRLANVDSAIINANTRITDTLTSLNSTNTALRTIISNNEANTATRLDDRMQVANTNLLVNDRMQVANTIALANARLGATASVTLTGDVSGTASFSSNAVTITTAVADDSHNHIISNVDGLQDALDNRMTVANTQALVNARLGATASVTLTGDITGSASFSGNSVSISTTYDNDVVLGTDTSGNYVATIAGTTNEIEVTGSGSETASVTIGLPNDVTITGDLTVSGGDITLGGTGRIQGIDTVSSGTDAANKTYVDNAVAGIVDSAPAALDTLNELAAALGDDQNFATTVATNLGQKLGATATITLTGDISGTASFSSNSVSITTTYNNDVVLGTDTSGNYVATISGGNGISGSGTGEGSTPTLALDINGLGTAASVVSTDTIAIYDVDAGTVKKATIANAALVGPTGDKGQKGQKGEIGATGPTGAKGNTGDKGQKGELGATGQTGAEGKSGTSGLTGPTGPTGAKGQKGEIGATGPTGAKGNTGPTGLTGPTGPTGDKGQKGEIGATGPTGPTGGFSTDSNAQVNSLGVGTAGSGTTGQIRATNSIVAFYSDARLKNFVGTIPNALDKVLQINGYIYTGNERAGELGYDMEQRQVGVSAQEIEAIMPEVIEDAPINSNITSGENDYKTVQYDRIVPLLIEAIKEQQVQIEDLKSKV